MCVRVHMCMGIIVYYNENPEYYSNSQLASQCAMSTRADLNDWGKSGEKGIESGTGRVGMPAKWESCTQWKLKITTDYSRLNSNFNYRLNLLKHL